MRKGKDGAGSRFRSRSIPLTNGSAYGRAKNMWILGIRIPSTGAKEPNENQTNHLIFLSGVRKRGRVGESPAWHAEYLEAAGHRVQHRHWKVVIRHVTAAARRCSTRRQWFGSGSEIKMEWQKFSQTLYNTVLYCTATSFLKMYLN
jgi:hypothetical protein